MEKEREREREYETSKMIQVPKEKTNRLKTYE